MTNGSNAALLNTSKDLNKPDCVGKTQEPPLKKIQSYNNGVTDRELLLLRKADDQEKNETHVSSFQLKRSLKLNHCSNKTQKKTTHELVLSSNSCTGVVEQLPDNAGHVGTGFHPLQLENSRVMEKHSVTTSPSRLTTANPGSPLTNTNSGIVNLNNKLCNAVVSDSKMAILGEPQTSNTTKTKSSQGKGNCHPTKAVNGKRISVASGIVYEDEVSSIEGLRCSTTAQTLLSSENSLADEEVPAPSSRQANNIRSTSSSGFRHVDSVVSSKLPPGSTLVGDRGVSRMRNKEWPFACAYCGKAFKKHQSVYAHIRYQHDEKCYSCEFCGQRYSQQRSLVDHLRIHTHDKPFICDQCGMRFHWRGCLRSHKFTHTEVKPFLCSICNSSYKCNGDLLKHIKIHNKEDCRGIIRNICSSKTEEKIIQEPSLVSNNCNALVEQLPDNTGLVESNIHPCQLEDSQIQTKPILSTAPRGLATTEPDSTLSSTNSRLVSAFKRSSEHEYNTVVSESKVATKGEPQTSNTTKTKSSQSQGKGYLTKAVNGKQVSVASGMVYEASSPESSRCSTTTRTLLSSNNLEAGEEVPAPSSRQANNIHGTSSSGFRQVYESMLLSKLPPGSTLVSDQGVFQSNNISEKPFGCAFCGNVYKRKQSVFRHISDQHDEKRYSCEFCGKRYSKETDLSNHVTIHTQEKQFTCDQCGKQFRFEGNLRVHKYIHSEERLFSCKRCNKSFKTRNTLSKHKESHNKDDPREGVICNICKRKLGKTTSLKQHMTIHTGEKPFKCSLCDKQFRLKNFLRKHIKSHNGKKRYADKWCSVCGKTVAGGSMSTHMRMHTGEKLYECNICGKKFPKKSNLKVHLRFHTGEKPFACSECNRRFTQKGRMMTHKTKCRGLSENLT